MVSSISDHQPILLTFKEKVDSRQGKRKLFMYEEKWIKDKQSELIIGGAWARTTRSQNKWQNIQIKLNNHNRELALWDAKQKRDSKKEIE